MRPMLAAKVTSTTALKYPLLASPKLDGIRCIMIGGQALTRNLKPVPNVHVRAWLEAHVPDGVDGELMLPAPATFQDISSCFMSRDEVPSAGWFLAAFDLQPANPPDTRVSRGRCQSGGEIALMRHETLCAVLDSRGADVPVRDHVKLVPQILVESAEDLHEYECVCLSMGYEGVMLRDPHGPYKYGRSTLNEGWLLKLKRFEDSEAVVIGYVALNRNMNPAQVSELGLTKRSHAKGGKVATEMLGALKCVDLVSGVEFEIGTGFTESQRVAFWRERDFLIDRVVKYKHFAQTGVKTAPRFPVWLGWRSPGDMDP